MRLDSVIPQTVLALWGSGALFLVPRISKNWPWELRSRQVRGVSFTAVAWLLLCVAPGTDPELTELTRIDWNLLNRLEFVKKNM